MRLMIRMLMNVVASATLLGCAARQSTAPAKTDVSPPVPVRWREIGTEKEFWRAIYDHPRVIVLFGTRWCGPCHVVKQWWETRSAPSSWAFVSWEVKNEEDYTPRVEAVIGAFGSAAGTLPIGTLRLPVISAIEGARPGAPIKDVVSMGFTGYDECTVALSSWLSFRPSGAKH